MYSLQTDCNENKQAVIVKRKMRISIVTWCIDGVDLAANMEEEENLCLGEEMVRSPLERVLAVLTRFNRDSDQ